MEKKKCTVCRRIRPLTMFYNQKSTKDGLAYQCKDCAKKRAHPYSEIGNIRNDYEDWKYEDFRRGYFMLLGQRQTDLVTIAHWERMYTSLLADFHTMKLAVDKPQIEEVE